MQIEQYYSESEKYVLELIENEGYPEEHPFNDYPDTPESMPITILVFVYMFTKNKDMIKDYVVKCKGVEKGVFSDVKYKQGISEISWLYYLLVGIIYNKKIKLIDIFDENKKLINNDKKFEYSLLLDSPSCITAIEVKAITCDPFFKEKGFSIEDGKKLIKPFFPQLKDSDFIKSQTDREILQSSTYYWQLEQNIKRIAQKCAGENISGNKLYCFGVIFINAATSFEEFYAYLFNEKYGLYHFVQDSKIDVLCLVSFDAKNDVKFDNIYKNGYVKTIIPHPSEELLEICKCLRMDNFIAVGDKINKYVLEKSKEEYGYYKILCREGFLNIIPDDASEDEINDYVTYLKNKEVQ